MDITSKKSPPVSQPASNPASGIHSPSCSARNSQVNKQQFPLQLSPTSSGAIPNNSLPVTNRPRNKERAQNGSYQQQHHFNLGSTRNSHSNNIQPVQEYGMHGFQKINSPVDGSQRPLKTTVQVSVLFNSKQDQNLASNQTVQKKAVLPNLGAMMMSNQSTQSNTGQVNLYATSSQSVNANQNVKQTTGVRETSKEITAPNSAQNTTTKINNADIQFQGSGIIATSPRNQIQRTDPLHPSNGSFMRKGSQKKDERVTTQQRDTISANKVPITVKQIGSQGVTVPKVHSFGQLPKIASDQKRIYHGQTIKANNSSSMSNLGGGSIAQDGNKVQLVQGISLGSFKGHKQSIDARQSRQYQEMMQAFVMRNNSLSSTEHKFDSLMKNMTSNDGNNTNQQHLNKIAEERENTLSSPTLRSYMKHEFNVPTVEGKAMNLPKDARVSSKLFDDKDVQQQPFAPNIQTKSIGPNDQLLGNSNKQDYQESSQILATGSQNVVEDKDDLATPVLQRQEMSPLSHNYATANQSNLKQQSKLNLMNTQSIKEKTQSYGEKLRKQFGSKKASSNKGGFSSTSRKLEQNSPLIQPPPKILQSKIIINLYKTDYPLIEQVAREFMNWRVTKNENPLSEFDLYWSDLGIDSERLQTLKPYQKVNHFPAMYQITRKTYLAKNLKRLQKLFPLEYDFFPRSWVVPNELSDLRIQAEMPKPPKKSKSPKKTDKAKAKLATVTSNDEIINLSKVIEDEKKSKQQELDISSIGDDTTELDPTLSPDAFSKKKAKLVSIRGTKTKFTMIIKPDCMSQGKGIFLTNNLDDLPREDTHVVQEYMKEPYLIDDLKFDIRLYVLILSCEPLKIFLYKEGIVRFATKKYKPIEHNSDRKELNNLCMHLTNYAVNKENNDFRMAASVNDDTGHKRSLATVLQRLKRDNQDPDKLMGEIKDIIVKTMLPIQQELIHNYRTCQPADLENLMCFEILGFDIILDKQCKPYLLEVNHAPSFATDSPLDYEIKYNLFCDTFKLLGLSVARKKAKVKMLYEEKKNRMLQKLTIKQKNQTRKQQMEKFQEDQDEHEKQSAGRYEKIFPLPVADAQLDNQSTQDNGNLSPMQKQLAQQQYQALVRQQERYNQLLTTINCKDAEIEVKMQNRAAAQKIKAEQAEKEKQKLKQALKKRQEKQVSSAQPSPVIKLKPQCVNLPVGLSQAIEIEDAMRKSITKPPGTLEERVTESEQKYLQKNQPSVQSTWAEYVYQAQQRERQLALLAQQQISKAITIKQHNPGLITQEMYTPNTNLQDLIDNQIAHKNAQIRQELARQQAQHPLSDRSHPNKFQAIIKNEDINSRYIDGLTPTITQIVVPSDLKGPYALHEYRSGEFDVNSSSRSRHHPQILPNINKNMISNEAMQNQEYMGSGLSHSVNNAQKRSSMLRQNNNAPAANFQHVVQSSNAQHESTLVDSPSPRKPIQMGAHTGSHSHDMRYIAQKLAQQAQTIRLHGSATGTGTMAQVKMTPFVDQNGQYKISNMCLTQSPPMNQTSQQTQKFSKIQLQSIIDNLYTYESKKKQSWQGGSAGKDSQVPQLSRTSVINPVFGVNLPDVNQQSSVIEKAQNYAFANIVTSQNQSKSQVQQFLTTHQMTVNRDNRMGQFAMTQAVKEIGSIIDRRVSNSGGLKSNSGSAVANRTSSNGQPRSNKLAANTRANQIQNSAPSGKTKQGGSRKVNSIGENPNIGKSHLSQTQQHCTNAKSAVASTPADGGVMNFNNCHVTIINDGSYFKHLQNQPQQNQAVHPLLRQNQVMQKGIISNQGTLDRVFEVDDTVSPGSPCLHHGLDSQVPKQNNNNNQEIQ